MIDYTKILTMRYSGKEWTLNGDTYDGLTWLSDSPKPSQKDLENLWPDVQTEILNKKIAKIEARRAILDKLNLTEDEAAALFR